MNHDRIWAINGDFVTLHPTGVARYAYEVTGALDALIEESHPLTESLKLTVVLPRACADLQLKRIQAHLLPEYSRPRLPQAWVQLQLPKQAAGGLLSFCNLAPIYHPRHIVCIHDLQTEHVPESYTWLFRLAHRVILSKLGRRANFITTASNQSRDQLLEFGIGDAKRIVVTYSGADHTSRWNPKNSTLEVGARPYLLCIGRNEHHKNMSLIWRIAEPLDQLGLDIYMPGDISETTRFSLSTKIPGNIRFLGRVTDDDLAALYSRAMCYALPSRTEGFALTAIEAMKFGCAVIASVAPSMPESCRNAALYAHPDDVDGWVSAVRRLLADANLRRALVANGHKLANSFTWRSVALKHLELMAFIDNRELTRSSQLHLKSSLRQGEKYHGHQPSR